MEFILGLRTDSQIPEESPAEIFCIAQFDPVCDLDTDTTYSNQCFATGAGAMNTVRGQCPNIIDGVDCNLGINRGHPPCFTGGF